VRGVDSSARVVHYVACVVAPTAVAVAMHAGREGGRERGRDVYKRNLEREYKSASVKSASSSDCRRQNEDKGI